MTPTQAETILLFGEVLADIFDDRKVFGGAPFNVARHLQAFGLHPVLITRTGDDELRRELLAVIKDAGMDDFGIQLDVSHPTGQVMVHMEERKHRFEILPEQAYDYIHAGITHMITLAVRPQLIYFGTLAQRGAKSAQALSALIRSSDAPRLLDINLRKPWYDAPTIERSLRRANLVKINQEELDILTSLFQLSGQNEVQNVDALIRGFGLDSVLVTCGEQGAWQLDSEGKVESVDGSSSSRPLVDTVGAGDGFASVYILGVLRGWPTKLTLLRANAFAATLCEIQGAIPDSPVFYEPFIKDWNI
ncbi:fructokinase [Nitrosomonas sp. Nm84]|uniref:carbohydrate kinase family protein n=1 Tax=Nitrosomonas sp. Nm84 TaxID=200124 RepID=UPI000D77182C|nr:carbohydrate kinase [Nitrosomonas sp. Nm84]PXW84722.1 fructokinase [Nitrosomonas sp. Nm84]